MSLNLTDATAELSTIPMRAESIPMLQQLANGSNPNIPGFLALAKMQELTKMLGHSQQNQPPQGTVKDRIEQTANTLATQGQQMQQMQQNQMQQGLGALGPAPQNVPQPVAQPQPEMAQMPEMAQEPVMAADGGILSSQIDPRLFSFAPGGIVAFSGEDGSDVKDREKRKREAEMALAREIVARNEQRGTTRDADSIRPPVDERESEMMRAVKTPLRAMGSGLASLGSGLASLYSGNSGIPSDTNYMASGDLSGAIMGERNQPKTGTEAEIAAGIRQLEQQTGRTLSPGARQMFAQQYITEKTGQVSGNPTPSAAPVVAGPATAGPAAGPRPMAGPTAAPVARPPAGPAGSNLPGVPPGAVGTGASGVMNLANQLTPKVADFDQTKAIADQEALNKALGIGTYSKNRREQMGKMKEEFESNRPSGMEKFQDLLGAFARPGARAGDIGSTYSGQLKTEREAKQKFAEAQDVLNDALEKADEAIRSGNATEIMKTKAEVTKAKQEMQKLGMQSAVDLTRTEITANAQLTAARIQAAASRAGYTKPSEAERVRAAAEKIFADAEANKKGSGKAAVDNFLEDEAKIRAAVGGTRYTGQNKGVEQEKMIQERVEKRTAVIDQQLQNPKLKPEKRAALEETRNKIERDVRKTFPDAGGGGGGGNAPITQAEYAKLLSGATYTAPDGTTRTKP